MINMTLEKFFKQRNSSQSTRTTYTRSVRYYEELTGHTITECIDIADQEEYNNIRWKNTKTREWILEYRDYVYPHLQNGYDHSLLQRVYVVQVHYKLAYVPTRPILQ